jgi:hypothetical protein
MPFSTAFFRVQNGFFSYFVYIPIASARKMSPVLGLILAVNHRHEAEINDDHGATKIARCDDVKIHASVILKRPCKGQGSAVTGVFAGRAKPRAVGRHD